MARSTPPGAKRVRIEGLRKSFGGRVVLDVPSLDIDAGEFFALLGPSGCGKTTALRSIAGLADPDAGRIVIGDRDISAVPTFERNLGMVFQRYALFPHLTIADNVGYGLHERGVGAAERASRTAEALALVALGGMESRYPHQLSGGQQQRVAIARAIVYKPDVLLLDEPLSNLDAKLRVAMRAELKRLHHELKLTTIFVTHDQQEALALADRIAVMHDGRVEQLGSPREIYDAPATLFVADFVGATNLLRQPDGSTVAVKPERITLTTGDRGHGEPGTITSVSYLGSAYSYGVQVRSQIIEARSASPLLVDGRDARAGDSVRVEVDQGSAQVFK